MSSWAALTIARDKLIKNKENLQRSIGYHGAEPMHVGHKLSQIRIGEVQCTTYESCLLILKHVIHTLVELEHVVQVRGRWNIPRVF